jgi:hypothetical protein
MSVHGRPNAGESGMAGVGGLKGPSARPTKEGEVSVSAVLRRAVLLSTAALALAAPAQAQDPAPGPEPAPVAAPSIQLIAPTPAAQLGAGVPVSLAATVPADVPVKVVSLHVDNGPPLCVFTRVHDVYSCPWTPPATGTGHHTILARVETTDGRLALATVPMQIVRLLPTAVGARTARKHLRGGGWRLTTRGTVAVPQGLTTAACQGTATITILAGARTVVDRSARIAPDCTFTSHVSFAAPRKARAVRVKVAYGGAPLLAPRSAPVQTVRLR